MSAYILNQDSIEVLTRATAAALQMAKRYPGSYYLTKETHELLGKYADDLHMVYRALYITNIKAVNGRYGEDTKTLPKYRNLIPWDWERTTNTPELKKALGLFDCYLYQCCEDPIADSEIYAAFQDVYKMLCAVYCSHNINWNE